MVLCCCVVAMYFWLYEFAVLLVCRFVVSLCCVVVFTSCVFVVLLLCCFDGLPMLRCCWFVAWLVPLFVCVSWCVCLHV